MSENVHKYRVLIVASHPVQYAAPLFRLMAKHPQLDIQVAYCSLQGVKAGFDAGFGVEVAWDIPLLDGYPWVKVENNSPKPKLGSFFGLINLGLWNLISKDNFDAVIVYTGYNYFSFWIAAVAVKLKVSKFLLSTDASVLEPRDKKRWKRWLKNMLLPRIFQLADIVMVTSTLGKQMVHSLGIPEHNIALTPYTVDNDRWISEANQVDVKAVRKQWDISESASVLLFCAKLQHWKRPHDVLRAFAQANVQNSYLIFAGEGPLRAELEVETDSLGLIDRVKFLGFVNQSHLSSIYRSADLFVLSSDYEPFGLVVNEAMLCGCPVIVSDQVGSRYDLVKHGKTGYVYPCGDIEALAKILQEVLPDHECLQKMGTAATQWMDSWSPHVYIEAIIKALEKSTSGI
ncbi:MAG TPA: glycosyltransferase family 4 protein [Nostoc sp.]|uniref:glycosyltransferase family 4 protein n=1 Tax=Nostoc sp. TaxID=1180 RepID=UPI002D2EEA1E|nr:glycosyltransferase family 4 protein [Nostoc sp.]HYX18491.1 glycosyltransferase family 4 protein [Nostoc sp.]